MTIESAIIEATIALQEQSASLVHSTIKIGEHRLQFAQLEANLQQLIIENENAKEQRLQQLRIL